MFNDDVPLDDSHDQDIPMMYSQGVHMSPDEMFGIRAAQASERKNCSSGSKRKQGSEHYETVEVIRSVIEFGNDQLKAIANWPKEKRATEVELRAEVVKQLQDIPELQSQDRQSLCKSYSVVWRPLRDPCRFQQNLNRSIAIFSCKIRV
ncbi:retrotransposon protein [Cucumis melo var. makuwa]|uniref:Retrotransposon protein n=1 Tax=Cucumis melo var. makuwa TaxID=1194695 RepID=A0A5A7V8A4_CUCMM|nr:retrotransposon protein [Cucumis melo var. makuwa]TYK13477.1 retrotransposon protein [Cucumis melo var. makuwa]